MKSPTSKKEKRRRRRRRNKTKLNAWLYQQKPNSIGGPTYKSRLNA